MDFEKPAQYFLVLGPGTLADTEFPLLDAFPPRFHRRL